MTDLELQERVLEKLKTVFSFYRLSYQTCLELDFTTTRRLLETMIKDAAAARDLINGEQMIRLFRETEDAADEDKPE